MRRLALVLALGLAALAPLRAAPDAGAGLVAVPALSARVTDLTGTLDDAQRATLEQHLATFEKAKGSQIAVLMLPSTQPESIEQYSIRVVEAWKLGRKGVDDGLLLLVAKNDHRVRFEVGYGLEGVFPDATANRVIDEVITPRFRAGDFYGGLLAGVDRAIGILQGEALPAPDATVRDDGHLQRGLNHLLPLAFFGLVIANLLSRAVGRLLVGGVFGAVIGVVAGAMLGSLVLGVVVGVVAALVCLLFSAAGGFVPLGGWGGGGFRSGGSGGGGFSGGGGSFGGGGASGNW